MEGQREGLTTVCCFLCHLFCSLVVGAKRQRIPLPLLLLLLVGAPDAGDEPVVAAAAAALPAAVMNWEGVPLGGVAGRATYS